jgi:hypothetical protein
MTHQDLGGPFLVVWSWWFDLGGLILVVWSWCDLGGLISVVWSWSDAETRVLQAFSWWRDLGVILVAWSWRCDLGGVILVEQRGDTCFTSVLGTCKHKRLVKWHVLFRIIVPVVPKTKKKWNTSRLSTKNVFFCETEIFHKSMVFKNQRFVTYIGDVCHKSTVFSHVLVAVTISEP